jgi:hypothetical protein
MFFTLAKVFWFVVQPLGAILVLLVLTVMALLAGWRRAGATFAVLALAVTFVSGWTSFGAMALHPLESRFAARRRCRHYRPGRFLRGRDQPCARRIRAQQLG